jgi:photosystem II stability/assembly factor-like uncharacterized protein
MNVCRFLRFVFPILLFLRLTDPAVAGSVSSDQSAVVGLVSLDLTASGRAAEPGERPAINESLYSGMKWRLVGPFRGGRALAVQGVIGEPNVYYFGAVAGGVWKTTDGGQTWAPLFQQESVSSIGDIAVAPSDHNVIYVGTGEAAIRGDITFGDGVYKSIDGGKNWKNIGLKDSRHIGAVIVNPTNPDIVFVAALGHAFGPNSERGIFKTTDGGRTWRNVLFKDENTGGIDVVFDPHNPNILFAALWQARRQPWYFSSGGPGSGFYRSIDGGETWQRLEGNGLPDGILGRIGVSVSGADPDRVYALIEAREGGLFRSNDGGDHWTRVNDDGRFRQRAWYFSKVYADPKSADTVYVLNTGLYRSGDGGRTFNLLPATHGDHHGLWIDPQNPRRLINANDGGASVSIDGGKTWTTQNNQPTAQFYHVAVDNAFPYHIYGAQQDSSNVAIASRSDEGIIGRQHWYQAGGGECGFVVPDPRDPLIIYSNSEGYITRFDKRSEQSQDISVWPLDVSGHGAADLGHRFQWVSPLFLSPHDPDTLYTAAESVFKSTDHGQSWTAISPDLTRNDRSKQQPSGGPLTRDITSVEYYDTIFALTESPKQKGLLWAGTDDGLIHLTIDDGKNWKNVTPPQLPEWSTVSLIEPSPHDAATAYVAVDRHRLDDFRPWILSTHDSGKTWTLITAGIPEGAYLHAVREDPKRRGLLYAGTETGVYFSLDDGAHWQSLQLNLPNSPVHDLVVKDDDLVVATHGRSFWVLDDLTPLRQLDAKSAQAAMILYRPQTAIRLHYPDEVNKREPAGDNPPNGAIIDYYFKEKPKDEVVLEILDNSGKLVRRLSSREEKRDEQPAEWPDRVPDVRTIPAEAGMNRYAWNLRYQDPVEIPGAFYSDTGPRGPLVTPGDYQIRLTVAGQTQTVPLHVIGDPRVHESEDALRKQLALLLETRDRISQLHQAVNGIRDLKSQIDSLHKRFAGEQNLSRALDRTENLKGKISAVEEQLMQVNMKGSEANLAFPTMLNEAFDTFCHTLEQADAAPTQPQYDVFRTLSAQLDEQLKMWAQIRATDLPAVNNLVRESNVPVLTVSNADNAGSTDNAGNVGN